MKTSLVFVLSMAALPLLAQDTSELRAARAVFEENLSAIRNRDRAGYLRTYLDTPSFAVSTSDGLLRGFDRFAKQEASWPDSIDASDIELVQVRPGVVYATYRYRVRYGADEHAGLSQRLFVKSGAEWKIAITGAADAPPGTPPPPRAIVGATLVDGRGGRPVTNANVVLRAGKIDCAGTAAECPVPADVEVTTASGMWLTPGLADAHVHFSQTGWADGRPDALDVRATHPYERVVAELKENPQRFARSYVCSGVTSVFDVGGYPWTLRLDERFAHDTRAPHVVAAGPLLSTLDHWLNLPAERQFVALNSSDAAMAGARYVAAQGGKALKVWYIAGRDLPVEKSAPFVAAAGSEADRLGLPLIVHATGLAEAKESLRAGADVFVHSVEDERIDDEFLALARKNGTIVIPTLTVLDGYHNMYKSVVERKPPFIDDPNRCVDQTTRKKIASTATLDPTLVTAEALARRRSRFDEFQRVTRENLMLLVKGGIPIATGTDAGNPLTLHGPAIYAEMEAMQKAGMTPMQVITSSTLIATRAMRADKERGSVEKGKVADLLLLAADPTRDVSNFRKIRYVVRGGEIRAVEELSAAASR